MKKKLTMMLLALVVALGGTSVAVMSGCGPTEGNPSGPSQTAEYTVKFTVNGKEVGKQTVKHGETLQDFAVPAKPGYTGKWVDAEGNAIDFAAAITADAEYTAQYTANTDTEYKTEYYFENVDGQYELDAALTKKLTGTTDTAVTAEGVTKEHYVLDETAEGTVKEGTIAGDGSLTLKLYYKLERVTVTFMANGEKIDEQEVRYGAKAVATDKPVPSKDQTVDKEYVFSFWTATEGSETPVNWNVAVTENVTVYAYYTEQTRTYQISGVFGDGATWYLAKDVEGNEEWSRDNRFNSGTLGIKYGEQFAFAVYASDEVDGKPEVSAVVLNDDGTEGAAIELTEADGMYVLTVGSNVKIKTSVKVKEYALIFNASVAKYEAAWVDAVKEEDVILALTDAEGNVTYFENALKQTVVVRAGVYEGEFVIKDESGAYETVATGVEVDVNNATAVDGKYAVEGTFVICQDKFAITSSSDWTVNGGTVTSPTSDRDHQLNATWDTFPAGKQDFVAVASFKLDITKDNQESDPTYGIFFKGNGGDVFFGLNRNGIRTRSGFGNQHDIASLYPKYGLGKAADAYDKVTEVVVKKGETIYVFISAERTDNAEIAKVDTKLIAVITKEGLTACTGAFYAADGENVAKLFDEGIVSAYITCQQSNPCFVSVYGYAFSNDAEAIDSYLGSADLKATVTVDGNVVENVDLARGGSEGLKQNVIPVELPEGKVAKTITVNGEKGMFEPTAKGVNVIINAGFTGSYAINITTEEGTYVKLTGYVKFNGEGLLDAMVTDGSSVTYTDINGKFEMLTLGAESYTLTATANGFKKVSVTVTDITKEIEINTTELLMNDTVIFDGVEYGGVQTNIKPLTEGGLRDVYVQGFDENGNEIYTSVTTSGYRVPLLYQTITSQKFIVKGSIKYNEIKDAWIRIGFVVRNADGKRGSITFYGEESKNVSHVEGGWGQIDGLEKLPMKLNGNPQLWLTGKWEVAMEYDNGNVKFYMRNTVLFGSDRWLHLYSGKIFQTGADGAATNALDFEGPVIVGMLETQNQNTSFVMSDFYASTAENFDKQITIAGTDNLEVSKIENGVVTVKAKEGFEITDIKFAGSTQFAKATEENGTFTLALPTLWMVEGNATVEVVTKEASAFSAIGGTVTVGAEFAKWYSASGATITLVGESGTVSAVAGEDGTYSIAKIANGTYKATVTNGIVKTVADVEVNGNAADKNFVLTEKDAGYYKQIVGSGIAKAADADELVFLGSNTTDISFGAVTFVPQNQILEMEYTLSGNTSGSVYPLIGFFVGDADHGARAIYGSGAGDCASFMLRDDWFTRKSPAQPWTLWKGGFLTGQQEGRGPDAHGIYDAESRVNLTVKLKVDGYKLSMYVKGYNKYRAANSGNWVEFNSAEWIACYENFNIYDFYNNDEATNAGHTGTQHIGEIYTLDQACYFGATHRQDKAVNGAYKLTNISFTITDRTAE